MSVLGSSIFKLCLSAAMVLIVATSANAAPVLFGDVAFVSPPADLTDGAFTSDTTAFLMNEGWGTLGAPLAGGMVPGTIPAGTDVSLFLLHADPASPQVNFIGIVDFGLPILGAYATSGVLDLLDPLAVAFGSPVQSYPTGLSTRGLELTTIGPDLDFAFLGPTAVAFNFSTLTMDEIRFVVATPEPGTLGLVLIGGALLLVTRRFATGR